jgi:NADPH-dependent 2,4-dienoyl-CoA reductase/sulfur reductase-like enzyme
MKRKIPKKNRLGCISSQHQRAFFAHENKSKETLTADLVVAGAGLGGCAAALAALRNGLSVILTEETDWIGGQVSQQGVPPDEHQWIETHGATQLTVIFAMRSGNITLKTIR